MNRQSRETGTTAGGRPDVLLRPFDPAQDYAQTAALIADVHVADGVEWFPTEAALAVEWAPGTTFQPGRDVLVAELEGRPVGAARTEWRDRGGKIVHRIEVWVLPGWRRRGIGRRLLAWAEGRAGDLVRDGLAGPDGVPRELALWTDADNPAGVGFARAAGYRPARYHFEMRRPLGEPIPELPLPDGLESRPVLPGDHRRIWDADVEAFLDHWEPVTVYDEDFESFVHHPDTDPALWQVAWDGDEVAGSVLNAIYPEENARLGVAVGWLDSVSVRRPWRGRGVASALIAASLRTLRERDMTVAALGVDSENPSGALRLYERLGFRRHRTWVALRKPL